MTVKNCPKTEHMFTFFLKSVDNTSSNYHDVFTTIYIRHFILHLTESNLNACLCIHIYIQIFIESMSFVSKYLIANPRLKSALSISFMFIRFVKRHPELQTSVSGAIFHAGPNCWQISKTVTKGD